MDSRGRWNDHLVGQNSYNRTGASNAVDPAKAGTRVFAPDLANVASNSPYVRRNVIPFLIEAPRFFDYHPQADRLVAGLKAFIEVHTRSIDGLNQQLTVDSGEAPYGGSGERIQTPTNVTRATSNPTHGCWELQGRSITKMIKWWIKWGIGDENTKVPLITTLPSFTEAQVREYNQTFFGATVLYVEPDPTMREVVSAWLCTNMYPTGTPAFEGSKDASQLGQTLDLNVEFTAFTDVSEGTELFARRMLQRINMAGMNPNDKEVWWENVSADVARQANGLVEQVQRSASNRIVV